MTFKKNIHAHNIKYLCENDLYIIWFNACFKIKKNGIKNNEYFYNENIDELIQADPEKASALWAKSSSLGDL